MNDDYHHNDLNTTLRHK